VFEALFDADLRFVQSAAAASFDWQQVSQQHGTPLQAIVAGAIFDFDEPERRFAQRLELLSWCVGRGADPDQHATEKAVGRVSVDGAELILAGTSAQSLIRTVYCLCQQDLISDMDPQSMLVSRLKTMQKRMAAAERPTCHSVVDSVMSHMWEEMCREPDFADVAVLSQPVGPLGLRCLFRAHSVLLCHASPVFNVMLKPNHQAWRESDNHCITLDESPAAVEVFLSMLYSGCFPHADCDCDVLITVAEMADKYQVDKILPGLAAQIRRRISVDNFAMICAYAQKYSCLTLLSDCESFVREKARLGEIRPDIRWPNATNQTMDFIEETLNLYALAMKSRTL
ncbi:spopl, partial [Symbiodinium pilosum]